MKSYFFHYLPLLSECFSVYRWDASIFLVWKAAPHGLIASGSLPSAVEGLRFEV